MYCLAIAFHLLTDRVSLRNVVVSVQSLPHIANIGLERLAKGMDSSQDFVLVGKWIVPQFVFKVAEVLYLLASVSHFDQTESSG